MVEFYFTSYLKESKVMHPKDSGTRKLQIQKKSSDDDNAVAPELKNTIKNWNSIWI